MSPEIALVIWALVGWCGTPPSPRPGPSPFRPSRIAGAIAGAVIGYATAFFMGLESIGAVELIATGAMAYLVGRLVSEMVEAGTPG